MITLSELLDSDIRLWEQYTVKDRALNGRIRASLKDDAYPEGWQDNIIQGILEGDSPRQNITSWHNFVKGKISAWQDRQAAAEAQRAEASRGSSGAEAASSGQLESGQETAQGNPPSGEETLEAVLESKVAALRRSVSLIETEIASTAHSLAALRERHNGLKKQHKLAEKFYKAAAKSRSKAVADAPKDSDAASPPSQGQKKSRRPRRRYGLVAGSVPASSG